MDSRRTVEVLCKADPDFADFAYRVLGARSPQQAWEILYLPEAISKMSPDPSELHVSGSLRPTGRRRKPKPMDDRDLSKGFKLPKIKLPGAPKKVTQLGEELPGGRIKAGTALGVGATAVGTGGALVYGKKKLGAKIRGYEVKQGERPPGDIRPNPAFGKADFNIVKTNDDKQQVFGWASVIEKDGQPVLDKQGDLIAPEEMENSAYKYVLESRKGGRQHRRDENDQPVHISDMIESFALTAEKKEKMGLPSNVPTGWWVGFKVNDPETWEDVKNGKVTSFSIHGRGKRLPVYE